MVFSHPPREAKRKLSQAKARLNAGLAEVVLQPLLAHLEEHPRDTAALFALVLIGSAHPAACEEARCSTREEAERLARLLESGGAVEWAAAVREEFEVSEPVELFGKAGARALDVGLGAHQSAQTKCRRARSPRRLLAAGLGVSLLALGMWREFDLRERWASVPPAAAGDLSSVGQRVHQLSLLIEDSGPHLGLPAVAAERLRLEGELKRLVRAEQVRIDVEERALELRILDAEQARERGLLALEAGSLSVARECFAQALERGGESWRGAGEIAQDLVRLSEVHLALGAADEVPGEGAR